jgi:hypothetical protein
MRCVSTTRLEYYKVHCIRKYSAMCKTTKYTVDPIIYDAVDGALRSVFATTTQVTTLVAENCIAS